MLVLGLTGGFGSGKSTAAAMFARRGAKVIDADAVTRRLLAKNRKCIKRVAKIFPDAILKSGEVNRAQLARLVFQNPRELKKLTDILYPEALKEVKKQIFKYKRARRYYSKYDPSRLQKQSGIVVLDVPLLFEAGWDRLAAVTVVVRASRVQQVKRIRERMKVPTAEVLKRLKFQMPLKEKCRLADIVIDNSGSLQNTRRQVDAITDRLFKRKQ